MRRRFRIFRYRVKGLYYRIRAFVIHQLETAGLREPRGTCAVCNVEKPYSQLASADWTTVYVDSSRGWSSEEIVWKVGSPPVQIEHDGFACKECVARDTGLGKFQLGDVQSLVLYAWSMDSSEDDFMQNEGWGYCARFGRYLLYTDTQGFVSSDEFKDEEAAVKEFNRLYREGWGFDWESGGCISEDRGEYLLSVDGNPEGRFSRLNRARAAMRLYSMRNGYYPDLWLCSERGNVELLDY